MVTTPRNLHPHDQAHWDGAVALLPSSLSRGIAREYDARPTRQSANLFLVDLLERYDVRNRHYLDDDAISRAADGLVRFSVRVIRTYTGRFDENGFGPDERPDSGESLALDAIQVEASSHGVDLMRFAHEGPRPALARACDSVFWARQLRTRSLRALEDFAVYAGVVRPGFQRYASDATINFVVARAEKNRELLERMEATNDEGQVYTVAELSDLGTANPHVRRAEMMTRIHGIETVAQDLGHEGYFVTLTLPSKFHSSSKKYNGTTPREAARELQAVWARTRSAWKRGAVDVYGLRVAEPHQDGCPHWHLCIWFASDAERGLDILRSYAMADDGDEPGADQHRIKWEAVDYSKGSATGYMVEYVSKNLRGVSDDRDQAESSVRVAAWASVWGIRQFQFFGGPGVGVWRELRRMDESVESDLEALRDAADSGDWARYVRLMGGPLVSTQTQPARVLRWLEHSPDTGEMYHAPLTKYGETSAGAVLGVVFGSDIFPTRRYRWEISLTFSPRSRSVESNPGRSGPENAQRFQGRGARGALDLCK